jgi:hypothetical protein
MIEDAWEPFPADRITTPVYSGSSASFSSAEIYRAAAENIKPATEQALGNREN